MLGSQTKIEERNQFLRFYMLLIIVLGAAAIFYSASRLPIGILDERFLFIAAAALICSGTTIQFPRVKSYFNFSDPFIFLTLLFFGGEAAVLLAALDGLFSSLRFCKKKISILFNAAMMGISTFLTAEILQLCFGSIENLWREGFSAKFIFALCVMGMAQYFINTGLSAIYGASKKNQKFCNTWKDFYLWNSISYFAGAAATGIIVRLTDAVGFYALVAVSPIVVILYLTHRMYLKNIEISIAQAEQSQTHAAQLQESEEHFRSAFDYASSGMALVSPTGRWLKVNRSFCEIVGYSGQELIESDFQSITHADDLSEAQAKFNHLLTNETPSCLMEKRYIRRDDGEIWVQWSASTVLDANGKLLCLIFQVHDISSRKRVEKQLIHEASHDTLTGLPNRAAFKHRLQRSFERAEQQPSCLFAVLFLDLDRFKTINDSLGHNVGDLLLISIARRLETCLREGDMVARLGGDEFTILLDNIQDIENAVYIAERINEVVARPFELGGYEVFTSTSVGIALKSENYQNPEEILRDADAAMYRAKTRGKARYEIFNEDLREQADSLLQMETDLRRALEREEFLVHYQPIVSLKTGIPIGYEALLRWQHPHLGLVPPDRFIPLAEDLGLIVSIGLWTLRHACRQMRLWQDRFPQQPSLTLSVNMSGKQFAQADLADSVAGVLTETGIAAHHLNLEITETVLMGNEAMVLENLRRLHELGVKISIDDFGTGYSSLSYLHSFPVDVLKIDRSFTSRLDSQNRNSAIVNTIVVLAETLGIKTVAEGIETAEQATQLRKLNCLYGQGYLFSKPLAAEAVANYLSENYNSAQNPPPNWTADSSDDRYLH